MKKHIYLWLVTIGTLSMLAGSGCSVILDPGAYDKAGSESADASSADARAGQDAPSGRDGAPCIDCDGGAAMIPDATCQPTTEPHIEFAVCEDAGGNPVELPVPTYATSNIGGEQVHLVSMYRKEYVPQVDYMPVDFRLPGENTLVLSAYEPVTWLVGVSGEGRLSRIVLASANQTLMDAPAGVTIQSLDLSGLASCGYQPRMSLPGTDCATDLHIAAIEDRLARDLSSHAGCYEANGIAFLPATMCLPNP